MSPSPSPTTSSGDGPAPPPRATSADAAWLVRALIAGVAAVAAFTVLAVLVAGRWRPLLAVDDAVDRAVHQYIVTHRGLLPLVDTVTNMGGPLAMDLVAAIGAIALLVYRRIPPAIYLVVARLLELGVETAVKSVVDRPRPTWPDPVGAAGSSSFPSGHSAGTAAVYVALLVVGTVAVGWPRAPIARRFAVVGVAGGAVLLLLVPISRVALGVHYPSDVLGGVLLGIGCALVSSPLLLLRVGVGTSGTPLPSRAAP